MSQFQNTVAKIKINDVVSSINDANAIWTIQDKLSSNSSQWDETSSLFSQTSSYGINAYTNLVSFSSTYLESNEINFEYSNYSNVDMTSGLEFFEINLNDNSTIHIIDSPNTKATVFINADDNYAIDFTSETKTIKWIYENPIEILENRTIRLDIVCSDTSLYITPFYSYNI
jgi:hypothetical protein